MKNFQKQNYLYLISWQTPDFKENISFLKNLKKLKKQLLDAALF